MAQAKKIALYMVVVFVLYTIITSPATGRRLVQIGFEGISNAAQGVGEFMHLAGQRSTRAARSPMIRHLVLFKLNDGVERDDPRVVAGAKAFAELGGQDPRAAVLGVRLEHHRPARSPTTSRSTPRSRTPTR